MRDEEFLENLKYQDEKKLLKLVIFSIVLW